MSDKLHSLAALAGQLLTTHHLKLATAESCTGGGLGYCMTAIAGSSAWYVGGFVTYSNATKTKMLGVSEKIIADKGAVSEETAIQMAQGAQLRCEADMAIAITGIAGPDGGSEAKPVGTVWFAWAHHEQTLARCENFTGNRASIREQAIAVALEGLIDLLEV